MSDRPADGERGSKMLRSRDLLAHTDGPSVIEEGSRSVEGTIEAVKKPPLTTWVHGAGMVRTMNERAPREPKVVRTTFAPIDAFRSSYG